MRRSLALFGLACCLCTATAGTLKAAAAEAISENDSKFEARGGPPPHGGHGGGHGGGRPGGHGGPGGHEGGGGGGGLGGGLGALFGGGGGPGWGPGGPPLSGNESFGGPTVIAMALPIAVVLIVALWIAAYNTLRSPPPKVGYNAGIVENAGWGNQAAYQVAAGYGYADAAASDPHGQVAASNLAASAIVPAAAAHGAAGGVAVGRALDNLTHRVTRSIESFAKKF